MKPPLRFLHPDASLLALKLAQFRRSSTAEIRQSLLPGLSGALKKRPDGPVLDGHHRRRILAERGENIEDLPREIIEKDK